MSCGMVRVAFSHFKMHYKCNPGHATLTNQIDGTELLDHIALLSKGGVETDTHLDIK